MLRLKLQYFGYLMWRTDSLENTLIPGKVEGWVKGTTEDEMVGWYHWLDGHDFGQVLGVGDGRGSLECCSMPVHGVTKSRTWLSNWTECYHTNSCVIHSNYWAHGGSSIGAKLWRSMKEAFKRREKHEVKNLCFVSDHLHCEGWIWLSFSVLGNVLF